MLGVFRYVLALMVVFSHERGRVDGQVNWIGTYAVFSFYMISGYLMTLVLTERYSDSFAGFGRFPPRECFGGTFLAARFRSQEVALPEGCKDRSNALRRGLLVGRHGYVVFEAMRVAQFVAPAGQSEWPPLELAVAPRGLAPFQFGYRAIDPNKEDSGSAFS